MKIKNMEKLVIVEKGNTIKSLSIESEKGVKICSGISPKNVHYVELFCVAHAMVGLLEEFRDDFGVHIQSDSNDYYLDKINIILNKLKNER